MQAFRLLMALAVLGCIAASATFAFEFGWTRGATEIHRWTYALAGVALDLLKSGLPILGAMAWNDSKPTPADASRSTILRALRGICGIWRPRALACWLTFLVLTGLSLWCAYGTTATQLAEKFASQIVAKNALAGRETAVDRLRRQRDGLQFKWTSDEMVRTAEAAVAAAVDQVAAERARGGCKELCRQREAEERSVREALRTAQQNRTATIKATELDAKIAGAEADLAAVDVKAAAMQADPQSASMAQAIGGDRNVIAALSHALFAVAIELGSGVGFWLVFGHGESGRCHERLAEGPVDAAAPRELRTIEETPEEIIGRFFLEAVRPAAGRVQSTTVWSAHSQWRAQRRLGPISHAMFGKLARWPKQRIGGSVYYMNCELADGCAHPALAHNLKALPHPGSIRSTTH